MDATVFPTLEEVLYLHELLIERYGGEPGVRDLGLVESALYRPRSGYYATLAEQSAALFQSLARNHGFVDGNKRVAFATTAVFLRLNGYRLVVDADDAEGYLVEGIIGGEDVSRIAEWIAERMEIATP